CHHLSLHLPHQPSLTHNLRPPTLSLTLTLPPIASAFPLVDVAPALGGATTGASHPHHPLSRSIGLSRSGQGRHRERWWLCFGGCSSTANLLFSRLLVFSK
ncbi:hypothetical protein A2U01_0023383, partial [Trifolium medium]|nr:hypothetical protein [Trifolium medium]